MLAFLNQSNLFSKFAAQGIEAICLPRHLAGESEDFSAPEETARSFRSACSIGGNPVASSKLIATPLLRMSRRLFPNMTGAANVVVSLRIITSFMLPTG